VTVAAAVLAPSSLRGFAGGLRGAVEAALSAGAEETFVVVGDAQLGAVLPEGATVLLDGSFAPDEASAARVALDFAARSGQSAVVVGYGDLTRGAVLERDAWAALIEADATVPVVVGTWRHRPAGLVRLEASSWSLLPLSGSLELLFRARPELVGQLELADASR
jgi:hypothetical protein